MKIRELEDDFKLKGSGLPRSDAWETGKIHASDVIRFVEWRLDLAPNKKSGNPAKWDLPLCGELGFIWEDILGYFYADRYVLVRPGEIEKDYIICSPDGIGEDPWGIYPVVGWEYKLTWKSSNSPIEKNWYYMTQFKTYAYALGVRATIVRLIHIMGDWSFRSRTLMDGEEYNIGPVRKSYRIEWDEEELEKNWEMILTNRDKMVMLGMMTFDEEELIKLVRRGKI